jgi:hypothetical protein
MGRGWPSLGAVTASGARTAVGGAKEEANGFERYRYGYVSAPGKRFQIATAAGGCYVGANPTAATVRFPLKRVLPAVSQSDKPLVYRTNRSRRSQPVCWCRTVITFEE